MLALLHWVWAAEGVHVAGEGGLAQTLRSVVLWDEVPAGPGQAAEQTEAVLQEGGELERARRVAGLAEA